MFFWKSKKPKLHPYYDAYGRGAHARVLGDMKVLNPYTYGTLEYAAWNDGYEGRE